MRVGLLASGDAGELVRPVNLGFGAIDRYGRRLEIRAEGFSPDGGRFFGLTCESGVAIKSESGKKTYRRHGADATLIEYQVASGRASTFDLNRLIPYTLGCGPGVIRVVGVTPNGEAVLALKDGELARQWAIQPESKSVRPFQKNMGFLPLNRTH